MFRFKSYICLTVIYLGVLCDISASVKAHECVRECQLNTEPMQCVYNFTIEWYYSMSKACYDCPDVSEDCNREDCVPVDGRKRLIAAINRQIPSPQIEVCYGDEVVVHLENKMITDSTTIHWHGMHQKESPYMDGVPAVTQCNILPDTTFTYKFVPDQTGTHFYHSHSGVQRAEGIFGALIMRTPPEIDPHSKLYDYDLSEHIIIVIDWEGESFLQKFESDFQSTGNNQPDSILINGRGPYLGADVQIPYQRFYVEQGYRYRFRLINAGALSCPIQLTVDNHTLTVISTDGNDIMPVEAESFVSNPGERFDFIINANQEEGVYWMKFKGFSSCAGNGVYQLGVLQYSKSSDDELPESRPTYDDIISEGLQINPINTGMEGDDTTLCMSELVSIEDDEEDSLRSTPDFKYVIAYNLYAVDADAYHKKNVYGYYNISDPSQRSSTPQLNHITMKFLPFPLLPGRFAIEEGMLCDENTVDMKACEEEYCACPHVVQIPLGAVIEIIFVDKNAFTSHPLHIHGTKFRVIGMERLEDVSVTEEVILEMDAKGLLKRNFDSPAIKDTIAVPGNGYTIVRYVASNPGYWFMHCHLEFHAEVGMGLVLKIGENEDMLDPPAGFPRCGDYE